MNGGGFDTSANYVDIAILISLKLKFYGSSTKHKAGESDNSYY